MLARYAGSDRPVDASRRASRVVRPSIRSFATYFSKEHEFIDVCWYTPGKLATIGITDFAQNSLGDIVFVGLPTPGDVFKKGDCFASVDSVKASSDVFIPASGTIKDVNDALNDKPSLVNESPMQKGWFAHMEVENPDELKDLMNEQQYKEFCKNAEH